MIAVCPQLNSIPMPTRKKPNSDQPAKMIHLVSSMVAAPIRDIAKIIIRRWAGSYSRKSG
jgi:exonuclease VII large subunit